MEIKERFIDPFTDFGFKKLFGSEPNKDLLIDFLNELLKGRKLIKNLTYSKNEHLGKTPEARKAVFDLYCENENGEKFIIELQKVNQQFFKDRSIYYSTFPIQEQAIGGDYWNYQLKEIYTVGIMDFAFDDNHPEQFQHEVMLIETKTKEVFYDKLIFIYLEMPKFVKDEAELVTRFDKWLYLLKNLNKFREIPSILQERLFKKLFAIAELSNLNETEMNAYEASLKDKRDWRNAMEYAMTKARKEGIEEGIGKGIEKGIKKGIEKGIEKGRKAEKEEMAKQMKNENFAIDIISRLTGLSIEEINRL
jgi:predicted transposase/invertase (TIGR01784 family)